MSTQQVELESSSVDPPRKNEHGWNVLGFFSDIEASINTLKRMAEQIFNNDVNVNESSVKVLSQQNVCIKKNTSIQDFACPCKNKGVMTNNKSYCKSEIEWNIKFSFFETLKTIGIVMFYHILFYGVLHKRSK